VAGLGDAVGAMEWTPDSQVLRAEDLEIRPAEHLALARGRALTLSVRELQVLAALAGHQGSVLTREELYALVWDGRLRADDRSVDVYVHKLRSKLARELPEWRFIHTHFGFGYRFQAEPTASTTDETRLG
jgi:DNA-binding response OmpR family regulator